MSEDSVFTPEEAGELQDTQLIRRRLVADLTASGVPAKGHQLLIGLLDGIDRQSLSRAKLRHDKASSENTQATAKLVAEMLRSANPRQYRPRALPEERIIPATLEGRTFVPGETDIGNQPVPIEQLMDKT